MLACLFGRLNGVLGYLWRWFLEWLAIGVFQSGRPKISLFFFFFTISSTQRRCARQQVKKHVSNKKTGVSSKIESKSINFNPISPIFNNKN